MNKVLRANILLTGLAVLLAQAGVVRAAQDAMLVQQGKLLAQSMCADCHTFGGATRSDRPALDFAAIGAMPSTTALSLQVFLKTSHGQMPNLILEEAQIEALSAFILDLGRK
jgi:mono/diheme cytochrome c family protein